MGQGGEVAYYIRLFYFIFYSFYYSFEFVIFSGYGIFDNFKFMKFYNYCSVYEFFCESIFFECVSFQFEGFLSFFLINYNGIFFLK